MENNQNQIKQNNASAFMPKGPAAVEILKVRAKLLSKEIIKKDEQNKMLNFIRFSLAEGECFGIVFEEAREVFGNPKITSLPLAPNFIGGVMNYRGKFIPVIDLAKLFTLQADKSTVMNYVIVVEIGYVIAAITSNEIQTSVSCDESTLDQALSSGTIKQEYIRGIHNGTTAILNMTNVLKYCQEQMKLAKNK